MVSKLHKRLLFPFLSHYFFNSFYLETIENKQNELILQNIIELNGKHLH